ncbi:MAG: acyl-CoA thioesterase [Bacteroidetes bacterium]|nr:acyl-CoA thioesterase [Bacteroidota bacterium]
MLVSTYKLRVRYAETDKMGYAYYGVYSTYLEIARVEALRSIGISYATMESDGIMLPVRDVRLRYRRPLKYDDLFTISTTIASLPEGSRLHFTYQIHNEAGELCTEAETTLVFADAQTGRPIAPPDSFISALRPFVKE